jgi:S-methylmethionine-dependent homocysteine/selenocysteine methylase
MHATRLSTSGCEIILARGISSEVFPHGAPFAHTLRVAAIASGCATQLPTWAVLETKDGERLVDGDALEDAVRGAVEAGVHAVLFDVLTESVAQTALNVGLKLGARVGVLLGAAADAQHAMPTTAASTEGWVAACQQLVASGASIIGGGAGTTLVHIAGLSQVFGSGAARAAKHSGLTASPIERQTSSE